MNRTNGFELMTINNVPYLLPYGQRIAENRRGMRLSESGVFLWNALPAAKNRQELLDAFASHYEALPEEVPALEKDMNAFLDELISWGMLEEQNSVSLSRHTYFMGGLHVDLLLPPDLDFPYFSKFAVPTGPAPDLTIEIIPCAGMTEAEPGKRLLISTEEVLITESESESWYSIFFPLSPQIHECRLQKDGSLFQLFVTPPFRAPLPDDLFHAIRLGFVFRAQTYGRIAVHSASLYYREKVWLFAGSSGTGKSTHTGLWRAQFDTPVINGDLNLISMSDGAPMVYGIPWCGTSGVSTPDTLPLGGIVHLKQDRTNHCRTLTEDEQILFLMHRIISPSWTFDQMRKNLQIASEISSHIFSIQLHCTAEPEAALYMKQQIDAFLSEGK